MLDLDKIINTALGSGKVKRALCVKLSLSNNTTVMIYNLLNVSHPPMLVNGVYATKPRTQALLLSCRGSESCLTAAARDAVNVWISDKKL
jgi:hypothetical protein